MGSYQALFHFAVEHLFFDEARCLNLDFVPTPSANTLLQKTGLLTRNTVNGIGVFYDTARTEALRYYLNDPDVPFFLRYNIFSKDPLFRNYTQSPAYKDGALLYFDSRAARADVGGGFCLHESEYVSEVDFKSFESPELVHVLSRKDRLLKPVFVVNISFSEAVLADPAKHYTVKFDARKTTWKYFVLGDLAEKEVAISDLNKKTEFEFGGTTTLPGQKTALIFRSKTAIRLRESLQLRFQLREKSADNGKVIIKRLPLASADQINTETINGKESVISEIYVNC